MDLKTTVDKNDAFDKNDGKIITKLQQSVYNCLHSKVCCSSGRVSCQDYWKHFIIVDFLASLLCSVANLRLFRKALSR